MNSQTSLSVVEALVASLQTAARFNSNDMVQPAVVLDRPRWAMAAHRFSAAPVDAATADVWRIRTGSRKGPAIWLRCAVDRSLEEPALPDAVVPVIYLPNISRQEPRALQECPDSLKPLVELQHRGVCWTQKTG